ncbi:MULTISPECIES: Rv3235 family protein [Streptomyces]|uniref:Rv3235 family protein n=1 Tax=Streptomyces TaxID=1883 RepID=UPI000CD5AD8A|nr:MULTISPECIES: Rv3235 family protein [Streptomyces]
MRASTRRPVTVTSQRRPGPGGPGRGRPLERPAVPDGARPQHWFAQRLLLVLSGQRPVHSLLGHVQGEAFDQLTRLSLTAPLGPASAPEGWRPPAVRQVGVCRPATGVLEAFARVGSDERVHALAFRLERRGGRWWCCAVELGPRPQRRSPARR